MELSWGALAMLCCFGVLGWFWQNSLAARESANRAAMEACRTLGLQFLDDTVAFSRMRCRRGASGSLQIERTYVFDYTASSIERRQGFVVLLGDRVETVGYAQDETAAANSPRPGREDAVADQGLAAPVLHLEEWRTRRQRRVSNDEQPPANVP